MIDFANPVLGAKGGSTAMQGRDGKQAFALTFATGVVIVVVSASIAMGHALAFFVRLWLEGTLRVHP
jgi:hypothetical protein